MAGSCELCCTWGVVELSGLCPECATARRRYRKGGTHGERYREASCRRCGWPAIVSSDGTCRCCRLLIRLGGDDAWLTAELARQSLPPGRPQQLALRLHPVRLPRADPLRQTDTPLVRQQPPAWALRAAAAPAPADDPAVCVEEVPGQLGLFPPWPRTFTRAHASRIRDRPLAGLCEVDAVLREMARERRVGETWMFHTRNGARLAPASRPPDEQRVRPEALADLPQMAPTLKEAFDRAGLLARPRARIVPTWYGPRQGSCRDCLAWTNERAQRCAGCLNWAHGHPSGTCHRCGRWVALHDGYCRRCVLVLAETAYDLDAVGLHGGDQLWLGGPLAPRQRTSRVGDLYGPRRLQRKRNQAVRASRRARSTCAPGPVPGQLELFHLARDWSRLDQRRLPALTFAAEQLLDDFTAHARARRWASSTIEPARRTLRVLLAHLGAEAPLLEEDVRLLARQDHYSGARLLGYLRLIGHLTPDRHGNAHLARARRLADTAPDPFRTPVHRWIDVLTGTAARRSHPLSPVTVCGYVRRAVTVLKAWYSSGIEDLRTVTHAHIARAITELTGRPAQSRAVALRSLFRALKREGLIFHDPAQHAPAPAVHSLPRPLDEDKLRGALRLIPAVRTQLTFVLAAVHALSVHDQRGLLLDDLDRAAGTLLVRRQGVLPHTLFLDELTGRLVTSWLAERNRRWPVGTNPHLLVTAHTAFDPAQPPVSTEGIGKPLRRLGHQIGRLRRDRILDEARHTSDPLHLVRLFGIHPRTAMTYLYAAHPGRFRPDVVAP